MFVIDNYVNLIRFVVLKVYPTDNASNSQGTPQFLIFNDMPNLCASNYTYSNLTISPKMQ